MITYLYGLLKYLFQKNVSLRTFITHDSVISKKARVNNNIKIYHSSIGDYSYIGKDSALVYASVGKFCSISNSCTIGAATHAISNLSTSPIFTEINNGTGYTWVTKNIVDPYFNKIVIGNDVWIGTKVIVVGNVNIGNGAIIAAGAVVTKDIPAYAIVGGVPAKIIRYRFPKDVIEKLERIQWWNYSEIALKKYIKYFQCDNLTLDLLDEFERNISQCR